MSDDEILELLKNDPYFVTVEEMRGIAGDVCYWQENGEWCKEDGLYCIDEGTETGGSAENGDWFPGLSYCKKHFVEMYRYRIEQEAQ